MSQYNWLREVFKKDGSLKGNVAFIFSGKNRLKYFLLDEEAVKMD